MKHLLIVLLLLGCVGVLKDTIIRMGVCMEKMVVNFAMSKAEIAQSFFIAIKTEM